MEPDAIFDDPSFTIPFEFYQGYDIVSVADPQNAAKGYLDGNAPTENHGRAYFLKYYKLHILFSQSLTARADIYREGIPSRDIKDVTENYASWNVVVQTALSSETLGEVLFLYSIEHRSHAGQE